MRKKGAIIIEFIVTLPVWFFLIWGIMNIMLYLISASVIHQAAQEVANLSVQMLRGDSAELNTLNVTQVENLQSAAYQKAQNIISFDGFIEFFNNQYGQSIPNFQNQNIFVVSNRSNCPSPTQGIPTSSSYWMCIFMTPVSTSNAQNDPGSNLQQIEVIMNGKYKVLGNFIPSWNTNPWNLFGVGVATENVSSNFNYYTPNQVTT